VRVLWTTLAMVLSDKASMRRASGLSDPGALELWDEGPSFGPRFDPAAIWLFAMRNAILIALIAGAVGILCLFALWLLFDQYSATALVLVDPRDAKATATQEVLANIGPDSIAVESVVQIAKSDGFLGALIDQQGLTKDPEFNRGAEGAETQRAGAVEKLKAKLSVARRGATYVIDVTMKTKDPQKSARLANAAAKMIVDNQSQLRTGSDQRAIDFIGGKLADLRARVNNEETAAATLKAELQITDAGQGEILQERRIAELNQQLVLAKTHTQEMRARVDQLRKANANGAVDLPTAPTTTVLSALRQDYARLTRQAAEKETVLGARHPDVAVLRAEIADAKKQIAAEEARLIASAKNDYIEARQREAGLDEELRKAQADSGAGDQNLVKLRQAESDAKADRDVYDQLLTRQKQLIESAGFAPIDVRVASPAAPPLRASTPGWPIMLAASSLLGLLAGMGAAAGREARRGSPATSAEIERIVGAPVAGIVPFLSPPPSPDGVSAEGVEARWFADLCAATLLQLALRRGLLLVTSSRQGEGASTIAANIAGHWAREGVEVLLIQLGAAGGETKQRAGVIEVLAGEALLQDAILWRGAGQARLLTLGAGPVSRDETNGLDAAHPRLQALLRRCRRRFDMVIVDAPAVSTSPIARRFAPSLASLLVVEWDAAEAGQVAAAVERLESRSIGIVLNKADLAHCAEFEPKRAALRSAA
jgi:polysaccharide biosynthesis transport protein